MREAFEQAILEDPDEVAHYAAYADYLTEQGDPRGEFISVQLALEDPGRIWERDALAAREKELLDEHERAWLGGLAPHLLDVALDRVSELTHRWRRGFLASLSVLELTNSFTFAQALATEPTARHLRDLHVEGAGYFGEGKDAAPRVPTPEGVPHHWELLELIGSPVLRNLRRFQMGDAEAPGLDAFELGEEGWYDCHTYAPGLEHVVAGMGRIEELHLLCKGYRIDRLFALPNLTRLRVLRVYHFGDARKYGNGDRYEYPLDVLAANPALANLTHLLFHPHHAEEYDPGQYTAEQYSGPIAESFLPLEQVRALLSSPHLGRLTHLQLRLSNMGDAGVRAIIESGLLARLKFLDLRHGCVTDEGARLLAGEPDCRRLELLDLSRNGVTAAGLRLLTDAGVKARAEEPLTRRELDGHLFLFEGDVE
jgi:uncharacterized protein (TIGR02996 family)